MKQHLRPIERRVLAMRDAGLSNEEIGRRIRRSPEHVARIIEWTDLPRTAPPIRRRPRAIERRVLAMRAAGDSHEEIAGRFRRSARFIKQVEGLAHINHGRELLGTEPA